DAAGSGGHDDAAGSGGHDDAAELRTCYAGEPVARWGGSVAAVAGLGAAVASTLADLYDMGIVHGRLDGSHVLVADDGRPRLCGLAGAEGAVANDDVAALGALLGELLARCPDPPPRRLARRRASATARRALEQVVEQATDPVATRRPTARALAEAILAAVPDAGLPDTGRSHAGLSRAGLPRAEPPGAAGAAGAVARAGDGKTPDTLDRIWSYADLRSDEERWADALGTGPSELPAAARDDPPLPIADGDTPPWGADLRGPEPAADSTEPLAVDADLTRDHVAASGRIAALRRPVGQDEQAEAPARRRIGLAAAGVVAVGVAMAGAMLIGPGGGADGPRTGPPARPAAAAGDCGAVAAPAADVDGDGCPEALSVDDRTVDAGIARWSLGDPGDQVVLGDWDCDGEASAALLRPDPGEVFAFAAWAEAGDDLTVEATDRVDGAVGIRSQPDGPGCDELVVDLDSGGATRVEVAL
ncbi:MAG TPA: hypothetical protein VFP06_02085, partial [Acidimicrobiales bacterium]|nr:hypothetical protein [Acidimicrobiales bacterium]